MLTYHADQSKMMTLAQMILWTRSAKNGTCCNHDFQEGTGDKITFYISYQYNVPTLFVVVGNLQKRSLIYGDYCPLNTLTCHGQSGEHYRGHSRLIPGIVTSTSPSRN
jgi:hypothetical protein